MKAEGYKTGGLPTALVDISALGSIPAGGVRLLAHPSATLPAYATADMTAAYLAFDGSDSVVLGDGGTNTIDVIGFSDAGNQGADTSFVRIDTALRRPWRSPRASSQEPATRMRMELRLGFMFANVFSDRVRTVQRGGRAYAR
jgi:hypothetical protein